MDIGHSRLLKFLPKFKMAEKHNLKIEVLSPTKIESEVPRQQILRDENSTLHNDNKAEIPLAPRGNVSDGKLTLRQGDTVETYVPVITVKTEETNFGKVGLKHQSVKVTEDISVNFQHLFKTETKPGKTGAPVDEDRSPRSLLAPVYVGEPVRPPPRVWRTRAQDDGSFEDKNAEDKKVKTRIPVSRFKTAVDKVQRDRKNIEEKEEEELKSKKQAPEKPPRRSSIPKLSDRIAARKNVVDENNQNKDKEALVETTLTKTVKVDRIPVLRKYINKLKENDEKNTETHESTGSNDKKPTNTEVNEKLEDEFDKLYEEIVDTGVDTSTIPDEILNTKVKDPEKLEIKFEEIVHQYDEEVKVEPADKARYSKIPLLKRRSEQEIKIPIQSERRLSLKTSNDIRKLGKIKPINNDKVIIHDTSDPHEEVAKVWNEIMEINNNQHNKDDFIQSQSTLPLPEYTIISTPDAELVKVGLQHLALEKQDYNQHSNVPSEEESIGISFTPIEDNQNIEPKEDIAETIQEPLLISDNITYENNKAEVIDTIDKSTSIEINKLNNLNENNNNLIYQDDTVKVATINLTEAKISHKRKGIMFPNDDEYNSRITERVEERTKSRFINKPVKQENYLNSTELQKDIPIVKGKVSRILNRLNSHENPNNDQTETKPNEQKESIKDDLPTKGNLSKILNRITRHDIEQSVKKEFDEIPKKRSVLSKIAMFERPDAEPIMPKKTAVIYSKPQRTISEEIRHSPKIVHEVLKPNTRNGQPDKPFEVVTIDILKPVEVITTSEEQVLVVEDLKEQEIVYENLDDSEYETNPIEYEPSDQTIATDNDPVPLNHFDDNANGLQDFAEDEKSLEDHNSSNNHTNYNRFNSIDPRVGNVKNREVPHYVPVKEKINRLQSHEESTIKQAISTAELDLGDAVRGKVKNMIYRMSSFEFLDDNNVSKQKEAISVKERPRKRSVSEKIALFEPNMTEEEF